MFIKFKCSSKIPSVLSNKHNIYKNLFFFPNSNSKNCVQLCSLRIIISQIQEQIKETYQINPSEVEVKER